MCPASAFFEAASTGFEACRGNAGFMQLVFWLAAWQAALKRSVATPDLCFFIRIYELLKPAFFTCPLAARQKNKQVFEAVYEGLLMAC